MPLGIIKALLVLNALKLLGSIVGTKLILDDIDIIEAFDDITCKGSDNKEVIVFREWRDIPVVKDAMKNSDRREDLIEGAEIFVIDWQ